MASEKMKNAIKAMVTEGLSQKEAAIKVGLNPTSLSRFKKQHRQEYKELYDAENWDMLGSAAPKAIRKMIDLMDAKSEFVRFNAAKEIMDRTGFKTSDKVDLEIIKPEIVFDVDDGK